MNNIQRFKFVKKTKRIDCGCYMAINSNNGEWVRYEYVAKLNNNLLKLCLDVNSENKLLKNQIKDLNRYKAQHEPL